MKYLLSILLFLLSAMYSMSASIVEVNFEKKLIKTDSLALPKDINVGALIRLLPELLQRPGEHTLTLYEVQVDGMNMEEASDAVLAALQLEEVDYVEVLSTPIASDLNNGQSGAINIHLKSHTSLSKGWSGLASLGVSTEAKLMPSFMSDYHSEKITVRTMGYGEFLSIEDDFTRSGFLPMQKHSRKNFRQQLMQASVIYRPNTKNTLQLTVNESTSHDRQDLDYKDSSTSAAEAFNDSTLRKRGMSVNTQLFYHYALSGSRSLTAKLKYSHQPKYTYVDEAASNSIVGNDVFGNSWQGEFLFTDVYKLGNNKGSFSYMAGTKAALIYTHQSLRHTILDQEVSSSKNKDKVAVMMPVTKLALLYGKFNINVQAEYLWNKDSQYSDWTGRAELGWMPDSHHHVRMLLTRDVNRSGICSNEAGIEYIYRKDWGKHHLTALGGFKYCRTDKKQNDDDYNSVNLMGIYQYDTFFFLSVTGNHYQKSFLEDKLKGDYSYYNISVMPSVKFHNGWRTAMNLRYYSKLDAPTVTETDCLSLQVNVGKSWGAWSAYVYGRIPVTGKNEIREVAANAITRYELVSSSVGCGLTWRGDL